MYIFAFFSQGYKGSKGDMGMPGASGEKGATGLPGLPVSIIYSIVCCKMSEMLIVTRNVHPSETTRVMKLFFLRVLMGSKGKREI